MIWSSHLCAGVGNQFMVDLKQSKISRADVQLLKAEVRLH